MFEENCSCCGQATESLANGVAYNYRNRIGIRTHGLVAAAISGTELSRDTEQITKCGKRIRTIVFPETVRRIAEEEFRDVGSLVSVVTSGRLGKLEGYEVTEYDSNAGRNISRLYSPFTGDPIREIRVTPGLRDLDRWAFYGLRTLRKVWLPEGLVTIGEACFRNSGLEQIGIPRSVKSIGRDAFRVCKQLRDVLIPEDSALEEIGQLCFLGTQLAKLALPTRIVMTDDELGIRCAHTNYCVLPELENIQDEHIVEKDADVFVVPACVKVLEKDAFKNCQCLRRITFRSGTKLEKIGENCLMGKGLEEFVAPPTLRTISNKAFRGC